MVHVVRKVLYFLGELEAGDIDWFIYTGRKMLLPRGFELIREGHAIEALYLVLDGILAVTVPGEPDATKEVARLERGDVVGEMSFLDSNLPSATVVAAAEALVLALPRTLVEAKLATDHAFAARFYRGIAILVSSRLRRTNRYLGDLRGESPPNGGSPGDDDHDDSLAEAWFNFIIEKLKETEPSHDMDDEVGI